MKVFSVEIGGAERALRFTSVDGIELSKRFGKPLFSLLTGDALGHKDGKLTLDFSLEVGAGLLLTGLQRGGTQGLTEKKLLEWIDAHLDKDLALGDLVWPAVKAAFYAGIVTGKRHDLEAQDEDAGKAPAPPAVAS